jgi:UDP-N-acetylglucosamine 2-epimerase
LKARRCIAVATVARSDFGLYQPLLERIAADPALELRLLVSGAHFDPRFGPTVREIETAGYAYEPGLAMHPESDDAAGVAQSLGQGVKAFAQAFGARRPDLLVLLGDRTEMLAPARWLHCPSTFRRHTSTAARSRKGPSTSGCAMR